MKRIKIIKPFPQNKNLSDFLKLFNSKNPYLFQLALEVLVRVYMKRKKPSKKQNRYTLMVLKLLRELSKTPDARLSIREMSRLLQINHMAVSRAIRRLEPVLDIKKGSDFESFKLPLLLIRLKNEVKDLSDEELIKKLNIMTNMIKEVYK